VLALARDERVDVDVRERAAEALGRLGRAEEAAQAWLALARDEKVDDGCASTLPRRWAAWGGPKTC
jgi:hypothetical protein